jgi:hypothetical protein
VFNFEQTQESALGHIRLPHNHPYGGRCGIPPQDESTAAASSRCFPSNRTRQELARSSDSALPAKIRLRPLRRELNRIGSQ